jgi:hypothetical protein
VSTYRGGPVDGKAVSPGMGGATIEVPLVTAEWAKAEREWQDEWLVAWVVANLDGFVSAEDSGIPNSPGFPRAIYRRREAGGDWYYEGTEPGR